MLKRHMTSERARFIHLNATMLYGALNSTQLNSTPDTLPGCMVQLQITRLKKIVDAPIETESNHSPKTRMSNCLINIRTLIATIFQKI